MIHKTEIRVRYEETDRMGVAYYAKYLVWFEVARTEFFKKIGFSYRALEEEKGLRFMVVDARCTYKSPVTYDDLIIIETEVKSVRNTSVSFHYIVKKDKTLVATGETSHVFTNTAGKPVRIPEGILKALEERLPREA